MPGLPVGVQKAVYALGGNVRKDSGHLWSAFKAPVSYTLIDRDVFVTPQGSEGQGWGSGNPLTFRETNLNNASRVPDQTSWVITDVGVGFVTTIVLGDIQKIVDNTWLVYWKPGYERPLAPLWMLPAGWGLSGVSTVNAEETWANGFQSHTARRRLRRPIVLNRGDTFKFIYRANNATATAQTLSAVTGVWCDLYGDYTQEIAQ